MSFNSSGGHPSDKVELTRVDAQGAGLTTSTMRIASKIKGFY